MVRWILLKESGSD